MGCVNGHARASVVTPSATRISPGSHARRRTITTARPSGRRRVRGRASSTTPGTMRRPGRTSSTDWSPKTPAAVLPTTGRPSSAARSSPQTSRFFCVPCTAIASENGEPVQK